MADLTPEQRMNVDEWIGALRSGRYRQTRERLHTYRGGFCCLGVLCEVQKIPRSHRNRDEGWDYDFGDEGTFDNEPPGDWLTAATGLSTDDMEDLIRLNDNGTKFDDIADEIKRRAYGA